MEFHYDDQDPHASAGDVGLDRTVQEASSNHLHGSSLQAAELDEEIDKAAELHLSPDQLELAESLNPAKVKPEEDLEARLGDKGDVLDPGGGTNTVIGAGGNDIVLGNTEGSFNTIAGGPGEDLFVLGKEATNDIFDFDPLLDQLGLDGISPKHITFGQGTNNTNGGLDQPLDRFSNTVVLDKKSEHILASLRFISAEDISEKNFVTVDKDALGELTNVS